MQDRIVNICRISELVKGDLFMWQGTWFKVIKITEDKVECRYVSNKSGEAGKYTLGVNSKQFVQVHKKDNPANPTTRNNDQ